MDKAGTCPEVEELHAFVGEKSAIRFGGGFVSATSGFVVIIVNMVLAIGFVVVMGVVRGRCGRGRLVLV